MQRNWFVCPGAWETQCIIIKTMAEIFKCLLQTQKTTFGKKLNFHRGLINGACFLDHMQDFCEGVLAWNCLRSCPRGPPRRIRRHSWKEGGRIPFYTHGMREKISSQLEKHIHPQQGNWLGYFWGSHEKVHEQYEPSFFNHLPKSLETSTKSVPSK